MGKRIFSIMLILFIYNSVYAQTQRIPNDPEIRQRTLPNGFTYFLKRTIKPDSKVYLDLVVKSGFSNEAADQVELAHLLEHMAFSQTKNFPNPNQYFESHGLKRGNDINAHTGMNSTVFKLRIPANEESLIENSLLFFSDCINGLILNPAKVDVQRKIVARELISKGGYVQDMDDSYISELYKMPPSKSNINRIKGLETFSIQSLDRFYKKWYRPSLAALIVVGDINIDKVEQNIKKHFSGMINPPNKADTNFVYTPLNPSNELVIVTNPKQNEVNLRIFIGDNTIGLPYTNKSFKEALEIKLFNHIMSERFNELKVQGKNEGGRIFFSAPIENGTVMSALGTEKGRLVLLSESNQVFNIDAFNSVVTEIERVKKFGFLKSELEQAKSKISQSELEGYESPSAISQRIRNYYVKNIPMPSLGYASSLVRNSLGEITLKDLQVIVEKWINHYSNTDIVILGPEIIRSQNLIREQLFNRLDSIRHLRLTPFEYRTAKQIISNDQLSKIPLRKPVLATKDVKLNLGHLQFKNGVNVYLKPLKTDEHGLVYIRGFKRLTTKDKNNGMSYITSAINQSGVGNLTAKELSGIFTKYNLNVGPYVQDDFINLGGFANSGNVKQLMQLVYLYMTNPKLESVGYNTDIQNSDSQKSNLTIASKATIFESHLRKFKEYLGSGSGLTFVIVGDFNQEFVTKLCQKYLSNIPHGKQIASNETHLPIQFGKNIQETPYSTKSSNARIKMEFAGNSNPNNLKNQLNFMLLYKALGSMLYDDLRGMRGGVYTVSVDGSQFRFSDKQFRISINFECEDARYKEMMDAVFKNIEKLKQSGVGAYFKSARALVLKSIEDDISSAKFWTNYLSTQIQTGGDKNEIFDRKLTLEKVTESDVQKAAQYYLKMDNYSETIQLPAKSDTIKQPTVPKKDVVYEIDCKTNLDSTYKWLVHKYSEKEADSIFRLVKIRCYKSNNQVDNFIKEFILYKQLFGTNRNSSELNNDAWTVLRFSNDTEELKIALSWSKSSLSSEMEKDNGYYLDTYANLLHKLNVKAQAIDVEEKALKLVKPNFRSDIIVTLFKIKNSEPTWDTPHSKENSKKKQNGGSEDNKTRIIWKEISETLKNIYSQHQIDSVIQLAKVKYYKGIEDSIAYTKSLIEFTEKYNLSNQSSRYLNDSAWEMFLYSKNQKELKIALNWSKKTLADTENKGLYNFFDTYANILHKLGRKEDAIHAMSKAITLCPLNEKEIHRRTLNKIQNGEPTWKTL